MSQLDLFSTPEVANCGHCVHRNAFVKDRVGWCSPKGDRLDIDPPCAWFFGLTQLHTPLYGRAA